MVKDFAARNGSALRSLAQLVGLFATAAAVVVGAVLAVVFAVMASALLGFAGRALRARRTARARADGVIEARHLGGHHWVAYGWNDRG